MLIFWATLISGHMFSVFWELLRPVEPCRLQGMPWKEQRWPKGQVPKDQSTHLCSPSSPCILSHIFYLCQCSPPAFLTPLNFLTEIPFLNQKTLCPLVPIWIPVFTGLEKFCCHYHIAANCLSLQSRIPFKKGFLFTSLCKFSCYLSLQAFCYLSQDLFSPGHLWVQDRRKRHVFFLHLNNKHKKKIMMSACHRAIQCCNCQAYI